MISDAQKRAQTSYLRGIFAPKVKNGCFLFFRKKVIIETFLTTVKTLTERPSKQGKKTKTKL